MCSSDAWAAETVFMCLNGDRPEWQRGCHGYLHELGGDQPEASLLEAFDDLATQASLDAVGLHGDEGALHVCWKDRDMQELLVRPLLVTRF